MAFTTQYEPVLDGGVPRTLGGIAREVISGGQFVYCSGATGKVNISGATSLVRSDIEFAVSASGGAFTGIAMHNAASGALVVVHRAGDCIVGAYGDTTAGQPVVTNGTDGVADIDAAAWSGGNVPIGRAVTSAGSEGYTVVTIGAY